MHETEAVWLDLDDVCARTGMSRSSAYRSIHEEGLPAFRLGGRFRVRASDLDDWIESRRVGAVS